MLDKVIRSFDEISEAQDAYRDLQKTYETTHH